MKNENFAERLYVDLKNAGIKIVPALFQIDGYRFRETILGKDDIVREIRQFVIGENRGKFDFSEGPQLMVGEKSFTQAYEEMLSLIKSIGNEIRFYNLALPRKGVTECRQYEFETVVSRYIVDYLPSTDDLYARWDVLVSKA